MKKKFFIIFRVVASKCHSVSLRGRFSAEAIFLKDCFAKSARNDTNAKVLILCGVLISFLFSGCGYSTRSALPSHFRRIHVELFKNNINFAEEGQRNIYFPLLEVNVRKAIMNRYLFDGNLKISDPEQADLILRGELKSYERTALRFSDDEDVQESRVHITVSLELFDTKKQETKWSESNFTGEATYFLTGAQSKSEETAIEDAITDLSRRIVERTIEDW